MKLYDFPLKSDLEVKNELLQNFSEITELVSPIITIPFASLHYYRAPESIYQNNSLLEVEELLSSNPSVKPLQVGERIEFGKTPADYKIELLHSNIQLNERTIKDRVAGKSIQELNQVYRQFSISINKRFLFTTIFIPSTKIYIKDLDILVKFNFRKHALILCNKQKKDTAHLVAYSGELYQWWGKKYGTDSFVVGAHFEVSNTNKISWELKFLVGLMSENKVDILSLILALFNRKGLKFIWNRREEINEIVGNFKFSVGDRK